MGITAEKFLKEKGLKQEVILYHQVSEDKGGKIVPEPHNFIDLMEEYAGYKALELLDGNTK